MSLLLRRYRNNSAEAMILTAALSVVMRGLDPRIHHLCKIYANRI